MVPPCFGVFSASFLALFLAVSLAAASTSQNSVPLELGQPVERELAGGGLHTYRLALVAGEFAQVVVDQRGLDVTLSLQMADGTRVSEINLNGRQGKEWLSIVAERAGDYQLEVRPVAAQAQAGCYEIRLAARRFAQAKDKERGAAERALSEGRRLRLQGTPAALRQAEGQYTIALPVLHATGDLYGQGVALRELGLLRFARAEYGQALDFYTQALALFRSLGEARDAAETQLEAGRVQGESHNLQQALEAFSETLQFWRSLGDRLAEAQSLSRVGWAYNRLQDYKRALAHYEQALPLFRAAQDQLAVARMLNNIGAAYDRLNQTRLAAEYYTQAYQLFKAEGDLFSVTGALNNLGIIHGKLREYEKALDCFRQAILIYREYGNPVGEAVAHTNISEVYFLWGKLPAARAAALHALKLSQAAGDRRREMNTRETLVRIMRDQGDLAEARAQAEQALALIETERAKVSGPELRAAWVAGWRELYELRLDILMRQHAQQPAAGHDVEAFAASERARARSLLELINAGAKPLLQQSDPQLAARAARLEQQIQHKTAERTSVLSGPAATAQKAQVERELTLLLAEYEQLKTQLRPPRYASLAQPLTLAEVRQQALDPQTLLLEYALGQERSYLFAVTPAALNTFALPPRAEIEQLAQQLLTQLRAFGAPRVFSTIAERQAWRKQAQQAYQTTATALSRALLEPVKDLLGHKRLLIVGDGLLQYVPFGALPKPETRGQELETTGKRNQPPAPSSQPLIAAHEIITLPSASTLAVLRQELRGRPPAPKLLAVLADPVFAKADERVQPQPSQLHAPSANFAADAQRGPWLRRLPAARLEAEAILALVPPNARLAAFDFDASRALATSATLGQYRYLHFATHSLLDNEQPELSSLALSMVDRQGAEQNGHLRMMDVFNLQLPAELVVLSGCYTALGKEVNGEGLIGLTRSFLYAGARRVLASLWQVNDRATAELMKRFYHELLVKRQRPAAALRAAQLALQRDARWNSPYYWAGFVLQGDW